MSDDPRADEIRAKLAELGPTADAMADSRCPLANFLRADGVDGVNVTRLDIEDATANYFRDPVAWSRRWMMPTPPAASAFVTRFDHGHFPDLIDERPVDPTSAGVTA